MGVNTEKKKLNTSEVRIFFPLTWKVTERLQQPEPVEGPAIQRCCPVPSVTAHELLSCYITPLK